LQTKDEQKGKPANIREQKEKPTKKKGTEWKTCK
jgi:hypothetical protein